MPSNRNHAFLMKNDLWNHLNEWFKGKDRFETQLVAWNKNVWEILQTTGDNTKKLKSWRKIWDFEGRSRRASVQFSSVQLFSCVPLLATPWIARSNQSILKEINPEYSLQGLVLKLKIQYFSHLMWQADSLEKTLMLERLKAREEGEKEDEMLGWHQWLNDHEFEQTLGDSEG